MVRFVPIQGDSGVAETFGAEINAMHLITLREVRIESETKGRLRVAGPILVQVRVAQ